MPVLLIIDETIKQAAGKLPTAFILAVLFAAVIVIEVREVLAELLKLFAVVALNFNKVVDVRTV